MFSIVIPNYNGKEFLKKCLESIRHTVRGVTQLEIIVVDNGSSDGSKEYLQKLKVKNEKLKVIENKKNLGFAKAVNQGIRAARNDYVVVMNNDLKIDKNWFKVMFRTIKKWQDKEKIAAYFGKVLNWQGTRIESTGLVYEVRGKALNRDNGKQVSGSREKEFVFGASASIVIYYKPVLLKVGLFDEDFFAYEEDVDLSIRLQAKGWKTLYVPKAISYHWGGKTTDQVKYLRKKLTARNWWYIIIKYYSIKTLIWHWPEILVEQTKNFLAIKHPKEMIWVIKSLVSNFKSIWTKRKPKNIANLARKN